MNQTEFTDAKLVSFCRIIQVDGPPMAYFEEPTSDEKVERTAYVTLAAGSVGAGSVLALSKWIHETTRKIENELHALLESDGSKKSTGVIVWRKRPSIDWECDDPRRNFLAIMRVATIPMLTNEQWANIGYVKKEGDAQKDVEK